jgi:peptidoglycan/LPS O-acetylase OafA/YrhL
VRAKADQHADAEASLKKGHELAGIEILRFVCAFAVVVCHYQHFFFRGTFTAELGAALRPALPFYAVLFPFYERGWLAVPFFWTISGFIFYWNYSAAIEKRAVGFLDFIVRRFSRLYPLHFATLIAVVVGQLVYFTTHHETFIYSTNNPLAFAAQLLFASNWFKGQPESFNGPIWSVSIEVLIYLSFFAVARAFGPRGVIAALVAAAFSICFTFLHGVIKPEVFACGMYFFAGGAAQRLYGRAAALPLAAVTALAVAGALAIGHVQNNAALLLLLASSLVILMTRLGATVLRKPFGRLALLGNATYSSYLLHFPLQLLLVILVDASGLHRDIFFSPIAFCAFVAGVAVLSLLVYRHFELPAQSLIRALASGSSPGRNRTIEDGVRERVRQFTRGGLSRSSRPPFAASAPVPGAPGTRAASSPEGSSAQDSVLPE